ncbi:MAG: hypothetical protein VKO39_14160 [Cyanobacteriota bacterium]|nr:hypothetical protein [Cyanobacteriota bacterium]
MERLGVFLRQETAASAVGPGAMLDHANDSSEEGSSAVRLRSDPSLTQAYQSLWSQARPFVLPLRARGHKAMSVEVRQASWREVRAREIPIRHGQLLIMPEKVMLLWLEGDHLYLLQSSRQKDSKS